jgi:hypothetical protein
VCGQEETEEHWVVGKRSAGLKGFLPVWERTQLPRLEILERIKKKSLDELEDLIGGFSRDAVGGDILDDAINGSSNGIIANTASGGDNYSQSRSTSSSRSIIAAFGRRTVDNGG